MIITRLKGRLGNQMFNYAVARQLSISKKTTLKIDPSFLHLVDTPWADNKNSLYIFKADPAIATKEEVDYFARFARTKSKIHNLFKASWRKFATERIFEFDKEVLDLGPDVYLDGFWQSEKYFKSIENIIRDDFTLKVPIERQEPHIRELAAELAQKNSVMVNIRRGEYLHRPETNEWFGVLGMEYFDKAIAYMREHVENPTFYVFSDDIEWCQENIGKKYGFKVIDHSYAGDKFGTYQKLMALCKHQIIPNSTFAWWAAWLNENPNKIVVAPKKWFNKTKKHQGTEDLIPEGWITL